MTQRLALGALFAAALVLALCYATAFLPGGVPAWVAWPFMLATSVSLVAAMALGAARGARGLGRLRVPFALTFVILVGCFGLALLQPAPAPGGPLWLGLPPGAALVLYGVGGLPLLVLPLAYALTFDAQTLSAADLARVREAAARLRAGEATARSSEAA